MAKGSSVPMPVGLALVGFGPAIWPALPSTAPVGKDAHAPGGVRRVRAGDLAGPALSEAERAGMPALQRL